MPGITPHGMCYLFYRPCILLQIRVLGRCPSFKAQPIGDEIPNSIGFLPAETQWRKWGYRGLLVPYKGFTTVLVYFR